MFNILLIISLINIKISFCVENSDDKSNNTNTLTENQKQKSVHRVESTLQSENDEKQRNTTSLKDENETKDIAMKVVEDKNSSTNLQSPTKTVDTVITKTKQTNEKVTDNVVKQTVRLRIDDKNEERKQDNDSAAVGVREGSQILDDVKSPQNDNIKSTLAYDNNTHSNDQTVLDQEKQPSNVQNKKDDEIQPQYIPVHIYDAENAYFNTYNYEGPNVNENKGNILRNPIVKGTQTSLKSSKVNFYTLSHLSNDNSIMKRVEANNDPKKLELQETRPEIVLKNLYTEINEGSDQKSSEEDISYEKPLKHNLNKIRKILFNKNNLDKHQKSESKRNLFILKDINANEDDEHTGNNQVVNSEINEAKQYTEGFKNFGDLLQKLVRHIDDNNIDTITKVEADSTGDDNDSDRDIYNDVINSLKAHNKKIKNSDIHDMIVRLEKVLHDVENKPKNNKNKNYQSRFNIINREESTLEREKSAQSNLDEDISELSIITENKLNDIFGNMKKSKVLKIDDKYLELHANILKDLVERNDETLENYDWLGTTVMIQAGIAKLQDIIKKHKHRKYIPPPDKRLLKVTLNLYRKASKLTADLEDINSQRRRMTLRMPKNQKPFNILERLFNRKVARLFRRRLLDDVDDFEWSLDCLKMCINDLHTAIKAIGKATTYRNQHWFQNIKELYLNRGKEKAYLELFLHLVTAKLVGLLEDLNFKISAEEDYLKRNMALLEIIGAEFVLVMRTCNELLILKD